MTLEDRKIKIPCHECNETGFLEGVTWYPWQNPPKRTCDVCHGERVLEVDPDTALAAGLREAKALWKAYRETRKIPGMIYRAALQRNLAYKWLLIAKEARKILKEEGEW